MELTADKFTKFFESGAHVAVVRGRYTGQTGTVVSVEDPNADDDDDDDDDDGGSGGGGGGGSGAMKKKRKKKNAELLKHISPCDWVAVVSSDAGHREMRVFTRDLRTSQEVSRQSQSMDSLGGYK